MKERNKNILLGVLVVGIVAMTVVYASLSQTLNINGTAKVKNLDSSWNIHFEHIANTANEVHTSGYATTPSQSITLNDTTVTVPEVTLKAPGDKVEYTFKVVNEGDITGYINVINNIGIGTITYGQGETLTAEQKTALQNDIQVTLTYNDTNKTAIAYNNSLAKNEEKELILTIQYVNRDTTQVLPSSDVTFTNITASITYGQDQTSNSGTGPAPSNPDVVVPSAKPTMAEMCPGCVFAKTSTMQFINQPLAVTTSDSYSNLGSVFNGYIVEGGNVTRAFACAIEQGEAFCIEGWDASKYTHNVEILSSFLSQCNSNDQMTSCAGSDISGGATNNGPVGLTEGTDASKYCYVYPNGPTYCPGA